MQRLRLLLVFAAILTPAVALGIFLQGRPGDASTLLPAQAADEMRETVASLDFPAGYEPTAAGAKEFDRPDTVYEHGVGESIAGIEWFCAWAQEWRSHRDTDPARASTAIDTIRAPYPSGPFWQWINAPDRPGLLASLDAAQLGDPRKLIADMRSFRCQS